MTKSANKTQNKRQHIRTSSNAEEEYIKYSVTDGLTATEVEESVKKHGTNIIANKKKKTLFSRFIGNFRDPIIRILLISCVLNTALNLRNINKIEVGGILLAAFVSTFVSALSEHSSENAFERLSARVQETYDVIRDRKKTKVKQNELVVGDIVLLRHGSTVPCDGIIVTGSVNVDQSALTGESRHITKCGKMNERGAYRIKDFKSDTDLEDEVFAGCGVISGEGAMLCVRIASDTLFGKIKESLGTATEESPLHKRLSRLAGRISVVGYIGAALVALAYLFNEFVIGSGMDVSVILARISDVRATLSSLLAALSLAVSVLVVAVPEGLPMMITVILSSNMKRMIKKNVLVRKMVGIETSGTMSVLFCDKTGTLTEGKMGVKRISTPFGDVNSLSRPDPLIEACASCPSPSIGKNPTDSAFSSFAKAYGGEVSQVIRRIPFESDRRFSAASVMLCGEVRTVIRGAPETLIPRLSFIKDHKGIRRINENDIRTIEKTVRDISCEAGRAVSLCFCSGDVTCRLEEGDIPELTYLGTAHIEDRLRKDAATAVKDLQNAGIRVIMMTGDSRETAQAIARECGILGGGGDVSLSGEKIRSMSDVELDKVFPRLALVFRALPSDKLRLIECAHRLGEVSGMTGDGINDAPSLRQSDVGFAMGSGSEVAQAAADVVILDSRLSSIVNSVLFGRTIFKSIRKFITFQLIMNLCATCVSFIGPFIGVESPVTVVQMLWINMIMDTLGALAFSGERAEQRYLLQRPVSLSEGLVTGRMLAGILLTSSVMTAFCITFLKAPFFASRFADNGYFLTVFFVIIIFLGIFLSFSVRTDRLFPLAGITGNPLFVFIMIAASIVQFALVEFGGAAIRCVPLATRDALYAMALASVVFPIDAIRKLIVKKSEKQTA